MSSGNNPGEVVALIPSKGRQPSALDSWRLRPEKLGESAQDNAYDFNGWLYHDPVSRMWSGRSMIAAVRKSFGSTRTIARYRKSWMDWSLD